MAKSKYEYVKSFEQQDSLLPGCWIVVRIDGKGFTKFCDAHSFQKPNDEAALQLMDDAAIEVLRAFPDIKIAYGESDEYSFVFSKECKLYSRRASKLTSLVVSLFSAAYVRHWPVRFPNKPLQHTPLFDARAVCYPNDKALRDYLAWRQVDTHVNNQYNTCFWALRHSGCSPATAQATLQGTLADAKNELLFSRFGINYNDLPARFKKGSVITWQLRSAVKLGGNGQEIKRSKREPVVTHDDIIKDAFWAEHPDILA